MAGGTALAAGAVGAYVVLRPKPAPIGFAVSTDEMARARALLARHPSIDAHAHPGRTFVDGAQNLAGLVWLYAKLGSFEKNTVADMRAGGLSTATFAAVSDFQVLGLQGEGLTAVRDFASGEAWASYQRQIANYKPVFDTYANLPFYVAGLSQRGLKEDEVAKLIGGNFLRLLEQVQAT